jgi:hypothetical protein
MIRLRRVGVLAHQTFPKRVVGEYTYYYIIARCEISRIRALIWLRHDAFALPLAVAVRLRHDIIRS